MSRLIAALLILAFLATPVSAAEWTAPPVPESGEQWMPDEPVTFTDGLLELLGTIIPQIYPSVTEATKTCAGLIAVILLVSLVGTLSGQASRTAELTGTVTVGLLLFRSANSMIELGAETVRQLSDYGMLLLPVMTSAMAAEGSTTASASLYLGTAFFDSVLSTAVSVLLVPLVYIFLALSTANSALDQNILKQIKNWVKWMMTWILKIILYVFTGYMGITGVVSGSTDAAALKAAKLTISGMVPVVGSILSDASEAVLVGAGLVKNAVGVYGLLAVLAVWIGPFLRLGVQYLMLKLTGGVCDLVGTKGTTGLIGDFTSAMGILLAMTGAECLMLLISTVCFMKGVG